ncbi:MAG: hypothetical protein QW733_02010 [Desulfurococcaceae archaeon]|uniref:hypothetical protein n=1 Tax=Desulfurococcus sp. TaxID=51678 RepID=UPI00316917E0
MGGLVKLATDMVSKYTGKMAADRVGSRYGAAKNIAISKYNANAMKFRNVIETVRGILSQSNVPPGLWGIYIAFAEKLASKAWSYAGVLPDTVVNGFIQEYSLKGADPAVLDKLASIIVG